MKTHLIQTEGVSLVLAGDGARIDSRVLAGLLDIQHENLLQNLETYREQFERFGVFRFETGKPPKGSAGGRPERFALLTEDQAYFTVTLSRNTARVVEVKARIVRAFSELRRNREAREREYLPFYWLAHDAAHALAECAKAKGSETPEHLFHVNLEKLINRAFGIEAGGRDTLDASQRTLVGTAYQLTAKAIADELAASGDHKRAYREAERKLKAFAELFGATAPRVAA